MKSSYRCHHPKSLVKLSDLVIDALEPGLEGSHIVRPWSYNNYV